MPGHASSRRSPKPPPRGWDQPPKPARLGSAAKASPAGISRQSPPRLGAAAEASPAESAAEESRAAETALRAQTSPSLGLTGLLKKLAATHLFLDAAPLNQFPEATNRFLNAFPLPNCQLDHETPCEECCCPQPHGGGRRDNCVWMVIGRTMRPARRCQRSVAVYETGRFSSIAAQNACDGRFLRGLRGILSPPHLSAAGRPLPLARPRVFPRCLVFLPSSTRCVCTMAT